MEKDYVGGKCKYISFMNSLILIPVNRIANSGKTKGGSCY